MRGAVLLCLSPLPVSVSGTLVFPDISLWGLLILVFLKREIIFDGSNFQFNSIIAFDAIFILITFSIINIATNTIRSSRSKEQQLEPLCKHPCS